MKTPSFRLFIAFDPPPRVMSELRHLVSLLKQADLGVRWEPEQNLHTTLRFLGNTGEELLPEITSSLREICHTAPPVPVRYGGLGLFPGKREPRVLWVGIEDLSGEMHLLQNGIEERMRLLGFTPEIRRFTPHLTIGRIKNQRHLKRLIEKTETVTFRSDPTAITEFLLIRSTLTPNGSFYTVLEHVGLGGNQPAKPPV